MTMEEVKAEGPLLKLHYTKMFVSTELNNWKWKTVILLLFQPDLVFYNFIYSDFETLKT